MQYEIKKIMFAVSIMTILIISVLGQIIPASAYELVKRDFSYLHNQHLTVRTGNTMICGNHMCLPGEWNRLSENLNNAQISHGTAKNSASTVSVPTSNYNSTYSLSATPSSTQIPTPITMPNPTPPSTPPIPTPIPTPPSVPYSVCQTVNATLTNSTISADIVAKIMAQLGCS